MLRTALALTFLAIITAPLEAQNLIPVSHFATDTAPWESPPSITLSHQANDGFMGPGAAEVEGIISGPSGNSAGLLHCFDVDANAEPQAVYAYAAYQTVNYEGLLGWYFVTYFDADNCLGTSTQSQSIAAPTTQGAWSVTQGPMDTMPSGTESLRISVIVTTSSTAADAITRIDDVYLSTGWQIFSDGFEFGNLARWSSSSP